MSKIKLGINGFGRIGRMVFRSSLNRNDVQVVGINDLLDVEHLAYLLKYDSVHGTCDASIEVENGNLIVNGNVIKITAERDPKQIGWGSIDTDVVAECTGIFTTLEKAQLHIDGGAKKVVISAPSSDAPMFVVGVNHKDAKSSDLIVSNASCTTNCLAPVAKVLNDKFVISEALMTTVHATTATLFTVDGPSKKDFRGGRSSLLNNFSVVDLTVKLESKTSYDKVMQALKEASQNELKGVLGYTEDLVVSQDFIGDTRTSIVDYNAGIELNSSFFKIVTWYDNEAGYSSKLIDLACHVNSI